MFKIFKYWQAYEIRPFLWVLADFKMRLTKLEELFP